MWFCLWNLYQITGKRTRRIPSLFNIKEERKMLKPSCFEQNLYCMSREYFIYFHSWVNSKFSSAHRSSVKHEAGVLASEICWTMLVGYSSKLSYQNFSSNSNSGRYYYTRFRYMRRIDAHLLLFFIYKCPFKHMRNSIFHKKKII